MQAARTFALYWRAYGGWRALFTSPYFWGAIVFTIAMAPSWLEVDKDGARTWPQLPLSILPNILGFSMGGMAIVLAFAGTTFLDRINEDGRDDSYFVKLVATFFHFIFTQTTAITLGLAGKTYSSNCLSAIGYFALVYSIFSAVATAGQLFNTARIANIPKPPANRDEGLNGGDSGTEPRNP